MRLLQRKLGIIDASAIVVGSAIGAGVFLKTAIMAQNAGTQSFVLLAWVLAGLMSLGAPRQYDCFNTEAESYRNRAGRDGNSVLFHL